jgi:hypothetical protein
MTVPPSTGASRVDNPGVYEVLYVGDSAARGACRGLRVEACLGPRFVPWRPEPSGQHPGTGQLLDEDIATVCDLDDATRLVELDLRPSRVVTKDRAITQGWALDLYNVDAFAGVRWWSSYDSRWGSYGVWDITALTLIDVSVLDDIDQPDFAEAADVLNRRRVR